MKLKNHWRIAAVTVAIGLTASALTGCVGQPNTPQDIVKAYLEAVQSGDAARAVELVNPGVSKSERALLTDDSLKKAGKIENIVVLAPDSSGVPVDTTGESGTPSGVNHLKVNATYDVDGKTAKVQFVADKTSDSWKVTGGYAGLSVPFSDITPVFSVNGIILKKSNVGDGQVVVFPGTYKVELVNNKLVEMKPLVQSTAGGSTSPDFAVDKSVQKDFDSNLKKFLDGCFAAQADTRDHACPNWEYADRKGVADVKWQLNVSPTYAVSFGDGEFKISQTTQIGQHLSYSWVSDGFFDSGIRYVSSDNSGADVSFKPKYEDGNISFVPSSGARTANIYGQTVESNFH